MEFIPTFVLSILRMKEGGDSGGCDQGRSAHHSSITAKGTSGRRKSTLRPDVSPAEGASSRAADLRRNGCHTRRSRSRELIASTTITIATVTRRTVEAAG